MRRMALEIQEHSPVGIIVHHLIHVRDDQSGFPASADAVNKPNRGDVGRQPVELGAPADETAAVADRRVPIVDSGRRCGGFGVTPQVGQDPGLARGERILAPERMQSTGAIDGFLLNSSPDLVTQWRDQRMIFNALGQAVGPDRMFESCHPHPNHLFELNEWYPVWA